MTARKLRPENHEKQREEGIQYERAAVQRKTCRRIDASILHSGDT
jgi:hypothetical protein